MKNTCFLICLMATGCLSLSAQTLFSFGNEQVSKTEFITAFERNNTEKPTEKAIRDYLELYSRYRLKVKAAYEAGLDTTASQKAELEDFRNQIIDAYLNDGTTLNRLIHEAYQRSLTDIHLAHIFIPVNPEHPADTAKAWKLIADAYSELKKGTDFYNVATLYSADTAVRTNKGDIGYITVFSLPYTVESIVYNLGENGFSKPYRSRAGYHIFKKLGERPAVGKIKIAQILLTFPPDADASYIQNVKKTADSISTALKNGASFNQLAFRYNTDKLTLPTNGEMPEFGVGKYTPAFEDAVFALTKPGEISNPIESAYGYHIVRLIQKTPVNRDTLQGDLFALWKNKVESDERIQIAKDEATRKIISVTGIKRAPINQKSLFIYADSIFQGKKAPSIPGIKNESPLFLFPKEKVTVAQWMQYLAHVRNIPSLSLGRTMSQLLDQFKGEVALTYYKKHLEEYNKDFARQVQEFKEGNMLFEIMQHNVWDRGSADSTGLHNYYASHAQKYLWEPSADVIFFTANDEPAANELRNKVAGNMNSWRTVISGMDGSVQADSGRYELTQLPPSNAENYKAGYLSKPAKKQDEDLVSFLYIVRVYPEKSARNFEDARGFVLNDYQTSLEEIWIQELKKKYPVKVNESVLKTLWQ